MDNNQPQQNSIFTADGVEFAGSSSNSDKPLEVSTPQNLSKIRQFTDFATFEKSVIVPGADAADATLYPIFYVATVQCFLLEAKLRHDVNSTSGVVDVEKIVDGVAKGSGGSMLVSKFDISTGARTTIRKTTTITLAGFQLAPGDAVALRATGTLTNAKDVCVTLLFGILNKNIPTSANV